MLEGGGEADGGYLLLLHEFRVGAVVDDVGTEDWGGDGTVDLFRVDVLELAVENEFVAVDAEVNRRLLSKEDEGKDISVLCEC